jgi:hypothetical protein
MRNRKRFLEQLNMVDGPLEKIHYICLVYLQAHEMDSGSFIRLVHEQFSSAHSLEWLRNESDLKTFAERICFRERNQLREFT